MPKVQIKNQKILVGGKEVPLISGEVHYWRLNANYWRESLKRVREMGLEIISTYVPWDFHEYKRGHFDFTGKTDQARNLKAFLDLTRKEGFWVILRPGPYIYSEWPRDGVPDYAYKYHRLHPQFLIYAKEYLRQVSKVFMPYLASRKNGHILMLQADNEIDPWPDVFGHQYGLSSKPGLFQEFMRDYYKGDLAAMNDRWGTRYKSFQEASPFIATMLPGEQGLPLKGDKELKRHLDYFKFKYWYSQECAKGSIGMYRDLGVDVPIYLNAYPFFYAHDWAAFQQVSDVVGVDFYPSNELKEDDFEHRKFCDKIRYLSSVSKLPFIAEFQSGIWHGRHYETSVLTPNHYRMICMSAFLAGVKGWNWDLDILHPYIRAFPACPVLMIPDYRWFWSTQVGRGRKAMEDGIAKSVLMGSVPFHLDVYFYADKWGYRDAAQSVRDPRGLWALFERLKSLNLEGMQFDDYLTKAVRTNRPGVLGARYHDANRQIIVLANISAKPQRNIQWQCDGASGSVPLLEPKGYTFIKANP